MKCLLICLLSCVAIGPLPAKTFRLSAYQLALDKTTKAITTELLPLTEVEALLLTFKIENFITVDLEPNVPNATVRERLRLEGASYTYDEAEQRIETVSGEPIIVGDKLSATLKPMENGFFRVEFTLSFDRIERWIAFKENPLNPRPIVGSNESQSSIVLKMDTAIAVGGQQEMVSVDGKPSESRGYQWIVLLTEVPGPDESA